LFHNDFISISRTALAELCVKWHIGRVRNPMRTGPVFASDSWFALAAVLLRCESNIKPSLLLGVLYIIREKIISSDGIKL